MLGGLYATLGGIGSCPTNRQQQMQRTALFVLVVVCGATLSAAIAIGNRDPNRNSGATLELVVYYVTSAKRASTPALAPTVLMLSLSFS